MPFGMVVRALWHAHCYVVVTNEASSEGKEKQIMSPIRSIRSNEATANGREATLSGERGTSKLVPFERCVDLMMTRLGQQKHFVPMSREQILSSW